MIDVEMILAETIRFEITDAAGEILRWGECSRWDFQFQAQAGETARLLVET